MPQGFEFRTPSHGDIVVSEINPRLTDASAEGTTPAAHGFRFAPRAKSALIWAGNCGYYQVTDNIHRTFNTNGNRAVSIHGWWDAANSNCPSKAWVDIELYGYGCFYYCGWVRLDDEEDDVYEGGGSANWVNARAECLNFNNVSYYGRVDVDLIGQSDPSGWTYEGSTVIACYPSN